MMGGRRGSNLGTQIYRDTAMSATQDTTSPECNGHSDQLLTQMQDAKAYWGELQNQFESLTDVAEEHGGRTLADLFYLHAAILSGGFIDVFEGDATAVVELVEQMPSAAKWLTFIRRDE